MNSFNFPLQETLRLCLPNFGSGRSMMINISLLTFTLCFLPLIMGLDFYIGGSEKSSIPIYNAIQSEEFRISLIISMTVAVPITIDFLFDIYMDLNIFDHGRLQRGILLLSLIVPDALIFALVIPFNDVGLLVCIFHLRNALITFAVLKHLHDYASSAFRVRPTVLSLLFFMIGHIISCVSAFTSEQNSQVLFFIFLGCLFIGFIFLGYCLLAWLKQMLQSSIKVISDLSTSDLNINVFLIPACLFGSNYMILCIIYGGSINANTPTSFLSAFTYAEAAFTVAVFMIQGRFTRLQNLRTEQACKQESMDLLQEIKSSCKSSLTILDELLDYDKLDAGILGLDRTLVCAWDLLQECLDPFIIQAKHAEITLQLSEESINLRNRLQNSYLHIDKKKIERAINGLLANAIKMTPKEGSVTVSGCIVEDTIQLKEGVLSDLMYLFRIEVTDTGPGLLK
eukprot:gene4191-8332_t